MELFGLLETEITKLQSLFQNYKMIDKVIIYGSRAKGNYSKFSDIDITLYGTDLNKNILSQLTFDIDDLLLPYTFDISIYDKISNPDVIDHIERVGKIIYSKQ